MSRQNIISEIESLVGPFAALAKMDDAALAESLKNARAFVSGRADGSIPDVRSGYARMDNAAAVPARVEIIVRNVTDRDDNDPDDPDDVDHDDLLALLPKPSDADVAAHPVHAAIRRARTGILDHKIHGGADRLAKLHASLDNAHAEIARARKEQTVPKKPKKPDHADAYDLMGNPLPERATAIAREQLNQPSAYRRHGEIARVDAPAPTASTDEDAARAAMFARSRGELNAPSRGRKES